MKLYSGQTLLVKSTHPTFLADSIQWFQGCDYHHAGTIFEEAGNIYVVEMLQEGIVKTPFSLYKQRVNAGLCELKVLTPVMVFQKMESVAFAYESIMLYLLEKKVPYDFSNLLFHQAVKYLSYKLFNRKFWIGKIQGADKRFVCGESAAFIQNQVLGICKRWYAYAPQDFITDIDFIQEDYK